MIKSVLQTLYRRAVEISVLLKLSFELCELDQVFCGLDRGLEESPLLAAAQRETLQHLVQPHLGGLVDG